MRKVWVWSLLILWGCATSVIGQKGQISGIVTDGASGERIPFVSVALLEEDGRSPGKGTVSDNNGEFTIEDVAFGRYRMVFSFIGYETDSVRMLELTRQSPKIDAGTVALKVSSVELDEVEVTAMAKTSSSRIDRKVYRAADFETAQGENQMFYMANTALNLTPEKLKGWDFSLKVLDFLSSNDTGLNTRAYDSDGVQIFFQETVYNRYGPIAELSVSYAFNSNGKQGKKRDSTFGKEQF